MRIKLPTQPSRSLPELRPDVHWCALVAALDPERAAYGGVAELWFPGAAEREAFASDFEDEPWLRIRDTEDYHSFVGSELVAIP